MITAQDIQIRLWQMVNRPPTKIHGNTRIQKSAFRQLLQIAGGVGFLACQPAAELGELARQGICSLNLRAILPEMAGVELKRRNKLRELANLELEEQRLLRQAAEQYEPRRHSRASGPTK